MTAILVLNCGSSSIKAAVFAPGRDRPVTRAQISRIGRTDAAPDAVIDGAAIALGAAPDHAGQLGALIPHLVARAGEIAIAGHRIVHGGAAFTAPCRIGEAERAALAELIPLARSHQPHNLAGIDAVAAALPGLPQIGCFDTAFHASLPPERQRLPLPDEIAALGVRRYGFHGLSYEWIAQHLPGPLQGPDKRVIAAHLGNGASLCGMVGGVSRTTTMGFTPLDGLIMGNRPGALDPGALLWLIEERGMDVADLSAALFHRSGLVGVSGLSNDLRTLTEAGTGPARLALTMFAESVARLVAASAADLGGVDGIVLTGGIGENARAMRADILARLAWMGVKLDGAANDRKLPWDGTLALTAPDAPVPAFAVATNEEAMIARHAAALL